MRNFLLILVSFTGLSALASGIMMILNPDGASLGLSTDVLYATPFHSFLVPGLLLALVVGGMQLLAFYQAMTGHDRTYSYTLLAGATLTGWIALQMFYVPSSYWIYGFYLAIGLLIVLLSYRLMRRSVQV